MNLPLVFSSDGARIAMLPLAEAKRLIGIFEHPHSAEGSWGWYQALAQTTLAPGEETVFAVAFDGKTAKAALPLVRRGPRLRALTAPYTTVYVPAFPDPWWSRYLGARAGSFVRGSLHLDALDLANPSVSAFLEGLHSSGLIAAQYQNFVNFYDRIESFEEYWNSRPSRLRATVRRRSRALGERINFCCYRDAFDEAVAIYEDVYHRSWKTTEPHQNFIGTMVANLAQDGFVRIGIMRLENSPVAVQIWLVSERKATIFKLAHREEAAANSPGTLLTHWMISTLIREESLEEIDLGRGGDTYKRDWLAQSRMRSGVIAGNWKTLAGLRTIAREVLPTRLSAVVRGGVWSLNR